MTRGVVSEKGSTRTAPNGYHYTKENDKWRLTHHILAEKNLGRNLLPWERVKFIDGNRKNLDAKNLEVVVKTGITPEQQVAMLDAQIVELTKVRDEIVDQMIRKAKK